jgi:hypothetical protein
MTMARTFSRWGWRGALLAAGAGAALGAQGLEAQIAAPAGQLVYAVYDGPGTAAGALASLGESLASDRTGAYAVITRDASGQIAVEEQPRGTLGRRVFLSGFGALLGPAAEESGGGPPGLDTLRAALAPGRSGVLALVDPGKGDPLMAMLAPTNPRVVGITAVGPTAQETSAEGPGIRASPPVQSSATGYTAGTDYEAGVGIEPGTGYTPGVGAILPDTADQPDDLR